MPPAMPAAGHIQLLKATEESIDIGITYECKRPRQGQGASALSVKDEDEAGSRKAGARLTSVMIRKHAQRQSGARAAIMDGFRLPTGAEILCSTLARFSFAIGVRFLRNLTCSPHGFGHMAGASTGTAKVFGSGISRLMGQSSYWDSLHTTDTLSEENEAP
jgi:hypothetical protein